MVEGWMMEGWVDDGRKMNGWVGGWRDEGMDG